MQHVARISRDPRLVHEKAKRFTAESQVMAAASSPLQQGGQGIDGFRCQCDRLAVLEQAAEPAIEVVGAKPIVDGRLAGLRLRHLVPLRPSLSFLSTIPRRQTTRSGEPMRQHAAEPMRLSGNLLAVPLFALPIVGRGSTASFFVQPGKIRIFVGIPEASPTERIDVVTSWRSRDAGQTAFKVFRGGASAFKTSPAQAAHCRQSREETRNLMETSRRLSVILASLVCAAAHDKRLVETRWVTSVQ